MKPRLEGPQKVPVFCGSTGLLIKICQGNMHHRNTILTDTIICFGLVLLYWESCRGPETFIIAISCFVFCLIKLRLANLRPCNIPSMEIKAQSVARQLAVAGINLSGLKSRFQEMKTPASHRCEQKPPTRQLRSQQSHSIFHDDFFLCTFYRYLHNDGQ